MAASADPLVQGCVGMVGLIFMLHFGLFHLLSYVWWTLDIDAQPLMMNPLRSTSVSEFWGHRWNTAFRDLTHRFLFRPLTSRWGPRVAIAGGFLFSELVYDLVISLPAGGGYGGPTVFVLRAAAMLAERSSWGRALDLGSGWRGWIFTFSILLVSAGILFHPPFVTRVIVPFMQVLGAS